MGGSKGAKNGVKWQGLKYLQRCLDMCSVPKFVAPLSFLVLNVDIGKSDKTKTSVSNYFLIVLSCVTVGRPVSGQVIR